MISTFLVGTILALAAPPPEQQTWVRNQQQFLPLQSDSATGYWGEGDRNTDHATVAINGLRDVLVAFRSSRENFNPQIPDLKQVEIALLEYASGTTE